MSGADGWNRRSVLAGGLSLAGLNAFQVGATTIRSPQITAPSGRYIGGFVYDTANNYALRAVRYAGIRYGRAQRFQPPTPVQSQNLMEEQAPGYGSAAPQTGTKYHPVSEDCLFLNVWTPAHQYEGKGPKLPVMVYFHGGAYSTGSVTDPLNDGAALAERGDVIVVTVNHRLNALGYLYLARLDSRFPDSGNAGQLDLILALQWIQRNIAAFSGDPGNVTIFGQSGGGAKIATLMAMPAAKGLFHKAITMSGQQVTVSGPINATKRAEAFLEKLGNDVDHATAPIEHIIAALSATDPVLGGGVYLGPVMDMRNLHRHPFWPDAAPQSLSIPMMLGNTVSETRAFYAADSKQLAGISLDNLAQRIAMEMRIDAHPEWVVGEFRAHYPDATPLKLFHRIVTAARSWRGQIEEAEARARAGAPAFVYQLDFEDAKHTDDIGLAFGTSPNPSAAQKAMSARMMDAFVRFAKTGNPGWEFYTLNVRQTMVFDTNSRVVNDPRKWERELFARIPYVQPGT